MPDKKKRARREVDFGNLFQWTVRRMIRPFIIGLICFVIFFCISARNVKGSESIISGAVLVTWAVLFGILFAGGLMVAQRCAIRRVGGESGKVADPAAWKRAFGMMMAGMLSLSMAISGGLGVLAGVILRSRNVEVASVVGSILFWFGFVLLGVAFVYAVWFLIAFNAEKCRRQNGPSDYMKPSREEDHGEDDGTR